jgi:hypothetical protein
VILAHKGPVMAQDAPTPEELQKQTELANKQRDLAKAQKELLDAQSALAAAQRAQTEQATQLAEQVTAANAAKDLATAQKAMAEAQKAKSEAQAAAFKAAIGDVPTSGLTGAITASGPTGEIEAALLAARAVRVAARTIDASLRALVPTGTTIAAMAVSEIPSFQNVIAYQTQLGIVKLALNSAVTASQGVPKAAVVTEAAGLPLLGGAGLVLDSVNKLLSFFRTDYTVAGIAVEASDLVAVTEVANLLAQTTNGKTYKVIAPGIYNGKAVADAGGFLIADITQLSATRQLADSLAKKHDAEVDALTKAAAGETDPVKKLQLQQDAARRKGVAEALRAAMGIFDTWFTKLSTADDKGVIGLVTIAKEKAIVEQLANGGKLLALKVQKAGGAYMTKKNLWTLFGGMPLYHMGGAAVTYALLDGTSGRVASSGVVPVYGGFVKSKKLTDELAK